MTRALVTGAGGFIGRHAVRWLVDHGYEVHGVTTQTSDDRLPREVVWHRADLLDPLAPARLCEEVRPTHLLHLAWTTTPPGFWTSPDNFRWVEATLALARAFVDTGGRRLVAAGTCAEYDWRHGYCVERVTPLAPREVYGVCKAATCELLECHARRSGVSTAWGRMFHLYGPGEHPSRLVASVIRALLAGETARCSGATQLRDYMFVVDAGEAFAALLHSDVEGPVNVGTGEPVRLSDLLARVGARLGRPGAIELGALQDRPGEPPLLVADVTRLRDEVGFRPRHTLDEGIVESIRWWASSPELQQP